MKASKLTEAHIAYDLALFRGGLAAFSPISPSRQPHARARGSLTARVPV